MTRSEYLETVDGQFNERTKRWLHTNYLTIDQEPKSKSSISTEEKSFFRKEVKKQLEQRNRRAHKGNIILEIDFYTTRDNPPALHTLTKNYLDLLHKEIPGVDSLKGLLFKDDNQIKILIANYHLNIYGNQKPQVRINSYPISFFIRDIELVDRIISNRFSDADSLFHRQLTDERHHESTSFEMFEIRNDLKDLEKNKLSLIDKLGKQTYELYKHLLIRQIQEKYLKQNEISVMDVTSVFQRNFSYNRKYAYDIRFQKIWDITKGYIFLTSDFTELGHVPIKEGEGKLFKKNLQEQLKAFKKKHTILFPLLHPINITITFIPPKHNVVDLDNLARYIVPFVHEIFQPPPTHKMIYDGKLFNLQLKNESKIIQKFPPYSISGYQVVHIPRQESDPTNGRINLLITEGLGLKSNLWHLIDDTIDKWESRF